MGYCHGYFTADLNWTVRCVPSNGQYLVQIAFFFGKLRGIIIVSLKFLS